MYGVLSERNRENTETITAIRELLEPIENIYALLIKGRYALKNTKILFLPYLINYIFLSEILCCGLSIYKKQICYIYS